MSQMYGFSLLLLVINEHDVIKLLHEFRGEIDSKPEH